jgi:hypothetical protein
MVRIDSLPTYSAYRKKNPAPIFGFLQWRNGLGKTYGSRIVRLDLGFDPVGVQCGEAVCQESRRASVM